MAEVIKDLGLIDLMDVRCNHLDTTSVSLRGAYVPDSDERAAALIATVPHSPTPRDVGADSQLYHEAHAAHLQPTKARPRPKEVCGCSQMHGSWSRRCV